VKVKRTKTRGLIKKSKQERIDVALRNNRRKLEKKQSQLQKLECDLFAKRESIEYLKQEGNDLEQKRLKHKEVMEARLKILEEKDIGGKDDNIKVDEDRDTELLRLANNTCSVERRSIPKSQGININAESDEECEGTFEEL